MKMEEVKVMIQDAGLTLVSIIRNRHWKAKVITPTGVRNVTFPTSLGDSQRGLKNKAAQLRALARGEPT